jgi:hypothetical protein
VRVLLEAFAVLLDADATDDGIFLRKWNTVRSVMMDVPHFKGSVSTSLADARALTLPDRSVDFVLTSPPYINVFNDHHNSREGIELLGWKPLVVARSEIGANRKFRQNRFLTVVQYCIDMALVLAELSRVCRPGARIVLVLGRESNVHKTAFFNGNILKTIATGVLRMHLHQEQERVFVNRFGQNIYEDILHLTPASLKTPSTHEVIERARLIGKYELEQALTRVPPDRSHYLRDAIAGSNKIGASPLFDAIAAKEITE